LFRLPLVVGFRFLSVDLTIDT